MKKLQLVIMAATLASAVQSNASMVNWVDWSGTASGTMTVGATTVGVTLSSSNPSEPWGLTTGDTYYSSYADTYDHLNPTDTIQVNNPSTFTITFDKPVVDLYMALVSIGQNGDPITYGFQNSGFSVVSSGPNQWGYGSYSLSDNSLIGTEYNGVLSFTGTYSSLTFTTSPNEFWHGFNFGAVSAVPEPTTMIAGALLLLPFGASTIRILRRKSVA
jgi:hypothetical protein